MPEAEDGTVTQAATTQDRTKKQMSGTHPAPLWITGRITV